VGGNDVGVKVGTGKDVGVWVGIAGTLVTVAVAVGAAVDTIVLSLNPANSFPVVAFTLAAGITTNEFRQKYIILIRSKQTKRMKMKFFPMGDTLSRRCILFSLLHYSKV